MSKLISIGKVLNFHGIKGEAKIGFTAGNESLMKSLKTVYIFLNNLKCSYDVESVRFHKNFAIIKFKQINSINDVETIKGQLVHITEDAFKAKLMQNEYLISDLIGLDVYNAQNEKIGRVSDVGENKASNILEIEKTNGLKFMVPFVKEWVPVVDIKKKLIVIKTTDGIDTTQENF